MSQQNRNVLETAWKTIMAIGSVAAMIIAFFLMNASEKLDKTYETSIRLEERFLQSEKDKERNEVHVERRFTRLETELNEISEELKLKTR